MAIKELGICDCGTYSCVVIKSCERFNSKLQVLNVVTKPSHRNRDQLEKSLPKMKQLQELIWDYNAMMAKVNGAVILVDLGIMAALHENTKIVKIPYTDLAHFDDNIRVLLEPIWKRNRILSEMPPLMRVEDPPPKNGIWLLVPPSSSSRRRLGNRLVLYYAFVEESRVKSVQRGFFPKGSIILSAMEGICWIYAPPSTTSTTTPSKSRVAVVVSVMSTTKRKNHSWGLFAVHDINLTVPLFKLELPGAEAASLVADGRGAAYVLLPTDPSNTSTCDRTLIRINSQYEEGKNILPQLVPCHSRLYRDRAGGVWIHVPSTNNQDNNSATTRTNEGSERLASGIWYITPFSATCIVSHVSPDAKINLDGNRTGLLIVSPVGENDGDHEDDSSSWLVHVGPAGESHRRKIPVCISNVGTVLDDGDRGALLHCRNRANQWQLCRVAWEEFDEEGKVKEALEKVVDHISGRAKFHTDGKGGVWIWKPKVGKRKNCGVSHVSRHGKLIENALFPVGTVMEGME